jgi:hypothetical protein
MLLLPPPIPSAFWGVGARPVHAIRDMLHRRTNLVANGATRTCKWLPRAIVVAQLTLSDIGLFQTGQLGGYDATSRAFGASMRRRSLL